MGNDELENVSDEEREEVWREVYDELMDEAQVDLACREAVARQPEPVLSDDEIPW